MIAQADSELAIAVRNARHYAALARRYRFMKPDPDLELHYWIKATAWLGMVQAEIGIANRL